MTWGVTEQIKELERLLAPGLIGMYRSFEVTEIVGFRHNLPPTNFLSLLVAEPSEPNAPSPLFLNDKRLALRGTDWKFGVSRYRIAPHVVVDVLRQYSETGEWKPGRAPLMVGKLTAVAPQFVPSDSFKTHPWNGVLKNNFWEGSHVLELVETIKEDVRFLLDEPRLLKDLAELISPYVPMRIDGLSDRVGNVLIQLPVTVAVTKVRGSEEGDYMLQMAWHPKATPRPMRASCEISEDSTVDGFASKSVGSEQAKFPIHSQRGGARHIVWDDANQVIVGASAQTAFLNSISMNISVAGFGSSITREFMIPVPDNQFKPQHVVLKRDEQPHVIGQSYPDPREPWRSKRVFRDSLHALQSRKEFVQYGGPSGFGREQALEDIRWLLNQHGKAGAWLWDPYLNAADVLNTLFFCPHIGSDLRALTAGNEPPESREHLLLFPHQLARRTRQIQRLRHPQSSFWKTRQVETIWKARQAAAINVAKGNCEGLKLEFRIREGGAGWSFHDRFLIFPGETGGAIAWSLGTSVNSLGRQHHILQKVADGELIRHAFLELWDALAAPDYLVWKTA